ncbi:MAG: hypothetical protein IT328_17985 [Caldilineaceae bacterium]|nr:hypothetical protein [Caldilineaceae bacterium]
MSYAIVRYLWLVCILLLGGCTLLPSEQRGQALEVEFEQVLPAGWEALGRWQPVNLDGDEDEENLLFFRFDSGQVGALIDDAQPAPNMNQPYRLLPRYFDDDDGLGQGIIAPPGTPADAIALYSVNGESPQPELVIRGGSTHLTIVWWKGEANGYGVTQLYAPGGFGGVEWEAWQRSPSPIQSVVGFYPLEDYRARSYLCRTVLYTRRADLPGIVFSALPQGLHFCDGEIPARLFAPEGVVLAYLLWPRAAEGGLDLLLTPGTTLPQLDAESAYTRLAMERIEDIAAYTTVPMRYEQMPSAQDQQGQGSAIAPTTPVCVEFAEQANPTIRRWVVFTLRYQPPDGAQRLPDRWTVSGALAEPAPLETPPPGYCAAILARNAP